MKYLVCGLCLQGNKGGPAIAASLIKAIREEVDQAAEFGFMVPGAMLQEEARWGVRFGVAVYPETTIRIFRKRIRDSLRTIGAIRNWIKIARNYDVIIEMQAIAYVGPPERSLMQNLFGGRFANFILCKFAKRPMVAWTQSLGPFNSIFIEILARIDLKRQPIVFCRGESALKNVRELLPKHPAKAYPDVACILPYDKQNGIQLIRSVDGSNNIGKPIATISPSAVLYRKYKSGGINNKHVSTMARLSSYLTEKGFAVYLVPHTVMHGNLGPTRCDKSVCEEILKALQTQRLGNCATLIDSVNLGPEQVKGIISNAVVHVSGRYHSVIAGLSSGVPTIALSWHEKYFDIMGFYDLKDFVYDGYGVSMSLEELVDKVLSESEEIRSILRSRQLKAEDLVLENARDFKQVIKHVTNYAL